MHSQGNRIILSGIAGDEITGGVPAFIPGLADLLVEGRLRDFSKQLPAWGLVQKQSWLQILPRALCSGVFLPARRRLGTEKDIPRWLEPRFVRARHSILLRKASREGLRKGLPSFRSNVLGFLGVRNQLGCMTRIHCRGATKNCHEKSFPYLDRDFVTFMFSIPRDQVLRPGQRRSLMRRSLIDIVPREILNRTRKGYFGRRPLVTIQSCIQQLQELFEWPIAALLGYVDGGQFRQALSAASHGLCDTIYPLTLTIKLEQWLRSLAVREMIADLQVEHEFAAAPRHGTKRDPLLRPLGAE